MKYVSLSKSHEKVLRKDYINQHARFIHSSWLLLEDLDKEVKLHDINYRIAGLWDTISYKKIILLQNIENGTFAYTESKEVANALGFSKLRNFVTGNEITFNLKAEAKIKAWLNKQKIGETEINQQTEETDDLNDVKDKDDVILADNSEYDYEEEAPEETDPIVRALQIDEEDSGWIEDNDDN